MTESSARRLRAEHILDVTRDLILRWGLKRVSMEEVAERAEVGKGTIYLHWKSRQELVAAVVLRSHLAMLETMIERIARDPRQALPPMWAREIYLLVLDEPLIQAIVTEDHEILGNQFDRKRSAEFRARVTGLRTPTEGGFARPVLRPDLSQEEADYVVGAILGGFFVSAYREPGSSSPLGPARRADLLARTIERAVINPDGPSDDAVAHYAQATLTPLIELRDAAQATLRKAYERPRVDLEAPRTSLA